MLISESKASFISVHRGAPTGSNMLPVYQVRPCISQPLGRFSVPHGSSVGAKKKIRGRRWTHSRRELRKTCRSVVAPSWLSSNRAWKSAPWGCGIHTPTVVYGCPCPYPYLGQRPSPNNAFNKLYEIPKSRLAEPMKGMAENGK